jgi:hypothetical protein
MISTRPDENGYLIMTLILRRKKTCVRLHRLIARQWIPNPENLPQIDHINGIKTDNRIENLRWCDLLVPYSTKNAFYEVGIYEAVNIWKRLNYIN